MSTEIEIQRGILDWLKSQGILHWRVPLGSTRKAGGIRTRSPMAGHPDIAGVFPTGRYFAIEVKTPTGVLSPAQRVFIKKLSEAGAMTIVARSLDDVIKAFIKEGIKLLG